MKIAGDCCWFWLSFLLSYIIQAGKLSGYVPNSRNAPVRIEIYLTVAA